MGAEEEMDEPAAEVKIYEEQASFDEFVVWGHEATPEANDDAFIGAEEWIKFAEQVRLTESSPLTVELMDRAEDAFLSQPGPIDDERASKP